MVRDVSHVALRVPDLEASVRHATEINGLREVERSDGVVYLTHGAAHHSLQLIEDMRAALDHVAFEVASVADLERLRGTLADEGVTILAHEPAEPGIGYALRFVAPGGFTFELVADVAKDQPAHYNGTGVRPSQFGHVTLKSPQSKTIAQFAQGVLGFRLSDTIAGAFIFLRCNPNHHALAIAPGPVDQLHHYAWEVDSVGELGRLGDHLYGNEKAFEWGPGRHGPGDNVFTYHLDPAGGVVEYYADLEIVLDDAGRAPRDWPDEPSTHNFWGPLPNGDFLSLGLDPVPAAELSRS
jgi:catechol-2,3-dioxygenase